MDQIPYSPLGIGAGTFYENRFDIACLIGAGRLSAVFEVFDRKEDKRKGCIKILSPSMTEDEAGVEKFLNKTQFAAQLQHPNIVKVFECFKTQKDQHYISMEFVDGVTLEELLEQAPPFGLTLQEVVYYLYQVAQALLFTHQRGLVHGDLRPKNILVAEDGYVKVRDFGIYPLVYPEGCFADPENFRSDPFYKSPEEIAGSQPDERSDIYSLGIIAYELLTRSVPFQGDDCAHIFKSISKDSIPELALQQKKTPPWLLKLIRKATHKKPAFRYGSMAEIVEILKDHINEDQEMARREYLAVRQQVIKIAAEQAREEIEGLSFQKELLKATPLVLALVSLVFAGLIIREMMRDAPKEKEEKASYTLSEPR